MGYSANDFEGSSGSMITQGELALHNQDAGAHPYLLELINKALEAANSAELAKNKNAPGGYAGLNEEGKILVSLLPAITTALLAKGAVTADKLSEELLATLDGFVKKDGEKQLSDNNFSDDDKQTLDSVSALKRSVDEIARKYLDASVFTEHANDASLHVSTAELDSAIKAAASYVAAAQESARLSHEDARSAASSEESATGAAQAAGKSADLAAESEQAAKDAVKETKEEIERLMDKCSKATDSANAAAERVTEPLSAENISYDNSDTHIESTNAGEAISELAGLAKSNAEAIEVNAAAISKNSTAITENKEAADKALAEVKEASALQFANALKGTASGEVIRVDDVASVVHSPSVRVRSRNLIPCPYSKDAQSRNGLTLIDNGDGTLTLNGTATDATWFEIQRDITLQSGQYYLSIFPEGWTRENGYIILGETSGLQNTTFTVPERKTVNVAIVLYANTSFESVLLKPLIIEGTNTVEFIPYVDPSTVTLAATGKNMLPFVAGKIIQTVNGLTAIWNEDGSVSVTGSVANTAATTMALYNASRIAEDLTIPMLKGHKYRLTAWKDGQDITSLFGTSGYYYPEDDAEVKMDYEAVTVFNSGERTIQYNLQRVYLQSAELLAGDTSWCGTYRFQLEVDNGLDETDIEYEPYMGATYTPNADGSVDYVKSISPTMTLTTDTEGAIIDLEYNRDLSKVIGELSVGEAISSVVFADKITGDLYELYVDNGQLTLAKKEG